MVSATYSMAGDTSWMVGPISGMADSTCGIAGGTSGMTVALSVNFFYLFSFVEHIYSNLVFASLSVVVTLYCLEI